MKRPGSTLLVLLLALLALPSTALAATASRTWVEGFGGDDIHADDDPPCSRATPCKTFAGAISATDPGGEINAISSGGYGAVTITKSITISATGVTAGVLVSVNNGINVAAGAGSTVILRGLDIEGVSSALDGIRVTSVGTLRVEDSSIFGFTRDGIDFQPTTANPKLYVTNTSIHDNSGNGVIAAPQGGNTLTVRLIGDEIENNACGAVASLFGSPTTGFATNCGTEPEPPSGSATGAVQMSAINTSLSGNTLNGVLSNGAAANTDISGDVITNNAVGLKMLNGGTIRSLGGNHVFGNGTDGAPTSSSNQAQGPVGPGGAVGGAGAQGAQGPQGPAGAVGGTGASGPAGKVDLVTCKAVKGPAGAQKCTGTLVASPVKITAARAATRLVVARSGHVVAIGSARRRRGATHLVLTTYRHMKAGRYTLTFSRHGRVVGHGSVVVRFSHV